ncbi:5380_t:CDS:2, partial [Acaulospora morrowiae]
MQELLLSLTYLVMIKKFTKKITRWVIDEEVEARDVNNERVHKNSGKNKKDDDVKRKVVSRGDDRRDKICQRIRKKLRKFSKKNSKASERNSNTHKDNSHDGLKDLGESITPSLPTECLHEIFYYIQHDLRTLNSCLQVSKLWCYVAISIFWCKPFRSSRCSSQIVDTFLKCLNKHEKLNLEYGGIYLGECKSWKTMFQYADFLDEISMQGLYTAVSAWIERTQETTNKLKIANGQHLICRALCRLFITRCRFIHSLSLDFSFSAKFRSYPYFLYHSDASKFLSNLRDLTISNISSRDLFSDIGRYCKNLKKLEIIDYTFSNLPGKRHDSARELIKSQVGLQHCKIFGYGESVVKPITGLKSQAKTL